MVTKRKKSDMADSRKRIGDQLLIRFDEGSDLRDRLDKVARANSRSLSAEIIHRLEESLRQEDETWLEKAKNSPIGRLRREMMLVESRLEEQVDVIRRDLSALRLKLENG